MALNQAINDIRLCRVDAAIVCSSNVILNPFYTKHLCKLGVLTSVLEPRVFDANGKYDCGLSIYITGVANLQLTSHMCLYKGLFVALDKFTRVPFLFLCYYIFKNYYHSVCVSTVICRFQKGL